MLVWRLVAICTCSPVCVFPHFKNERHARALSAITPTYSQLILIASEKSRRERYSRYTQSTVINRLISWLIFDTEYFAGPVRKSSMRSLRVVGSGRRNTVLYRGPVNWSSNMSTWFSQFSCHCLLPLF